MRAISARLTDALCGGDVFNELLKRKPLHPHKNGESEDRALVPDLHKTDRAEKVHLERPRFDRKPQYSTGYDDTSLTSSVQFRLNEASSVTGRGLKVRNDGGGPRYKNDTR